MSSVAQDLCEVLIKALEDSGHPLTPPMVSYKAIKRLSNAFLAMSEIRPGDKLDHAKLTAGIEDAAIALEGVVAYMRECQDK